MAGRGTIRRILNDHGIEPAPARERECLGRLLEGALEALVAADFFSVESRPYEGLLKVIPMLHRALR
jgi:hypothetical protein